jgi:hypothetical protein
LKMQKPEHNKQNGDETLAVPGRLAAAFQRLPRERVFVPPTVDEAILRAAERHLRKPERANFNWIQLCRWLTAAAAACLLLGLLVVQLMRPAGDGSRQAAFARQDFNHDGRVDILDAFALARHLKGGIGGAGLDVNGDGVVDERDVAALAAQAVKLTPGGRR